jgi:hypothetical protein
VLAHAEGPDSGTVAREPNGSAERQQSEMAARMSRDREAATVRPAAALDSGALLENLVGQPAEAGSA